MKSHHAFLNKAIELSSLSLSEKRGGPFGAVVVKDNEIIGSGVNEVTSLLDPTAHAEIQAIRAASQHLGSFSLEGCTIYSSCEPCPMCLSAIYWARIEVVYYANSRTDAAAIGFDDNFLYEELTKPIAERQLKSIHMADSAAKSIMERWQALEGRTPY